MKVKELIDLLQSCDAETDIYLCIESLLHEGILIAVEYETSWLEEKAYTEPAKLVYLFNCGEANIDNPGVREEF